MADATKSRPADAAIPTAVRDAFQSNRLQAAWAIASSATSDSRLPAIDGVCRILEKEGLTLADVMTAVLSIKTGTPTSGMSMNEAFSGFGSFADIFNAPGTPAHAAREAGKPRAPTRIRKDGADIPGTIHGTIRIEDERDIRNGRMLVFSISDSNCVYGPLVCFTTTGIERLKAANEEDSLVAMSVRQPNGMHQMPSVTNVRLMV